MRTSLWLLALTACGGGERIPPRPLGAADHYAEARRHDDEASAERKLADEAERHAAPTVACGDRGLAGQSTSGGVPVSLVVPCWTARDDARAHEHRAEILERDARVHRATAKRLVDAERAACERLPASEISHTPSWHREDILSVEPLREGGPVRGARLVFRAVEGLTADWLRAAYACHQAQAAERGYDAGFMGYCPAMLSDSTIVVTDGVEGIAVEIRSDRDEIGAAIWGRATDLVAAAPASGATP
jgi:hypothetical protein